MQVAQYIIKTEVDRILKLKPAYSVFKSSVSANQYGDKDIFILRISPIEYKNYGNIFHWENSADELPYPISRVVEIISPAFEDIEIKHRTKGNSPYEDPSYWVNIESSLLPSKIDKYDRRERESHRLLFGDPEFFKKFEDIITKGLKERLDSPIEASFGPKLLPYLLLASRVAEPNLKFHALWAILEQINTEMPTRLICNTQPNKVLRVCIKKSKAILEVATFRLSKNSLKVNIYGGCKRIKRAVPVSSRRQIKETLHLMKRMILMALGIELEPNRKRDR